VPIPLGALVGLVQRPAIGLLGEVGCDVGEDALGQTAQDAGLGPTRPVDQDVDGLVGRLHASLCPYRRDRVADDPRLLDRDLSRRDRPPQPKALVQRGRVCNQPSATTD
jgi:hypothetical protein